MTIEIVGLIAIAAVAVAVIFFVVRRKGKESPRDNVPDQVEAGISKKDQELTDAKAGQWPPEKQEPGSSEALRERPLEAESPAEPPAPGVRLDEKAEQKAAAALKEERRDRRLSRLRQGLAPTRGGLIAKIGSIFKEKKEIDPVVLGALEEALITADIGTKTSKWLIEIVKQALDKNEIKDPEQIWSFLKEEVKRILSVQAPPFEIGSDKPFTIMVVGVNGVGKTTTIGKLATKYNEQGHKVVLAAADTFRAAAVNQLEIWGRRANASIVKSKEGADPSSVVFDAIKNAKDVKADIVIADTAGRLHTKVPLMEELKKIGRVMSKAQENAPHQVLLVLDATTGQNAIQQVAMFKETLNVTGLVLTKLDGTAKGGVIIGICHEHKLPIRFIGIGEAKDDLREFEVDDFVDALFYREALQNDN